MSMFCYQCQETAGGKGCTVRGVCGKTEEVRTASGSFDLHA
jgi:hydroxylamine reductase